ncbi:MAG: class I lanthipeptide [Candidatus Sulfotelmatobacter sp.]
MKKQLKKLTIQKVTLRNLDEPSLNSIAGGVTITVPTRCGQSTCAKTLELTCTTGGVR